MIEKITDHNLERYDSRLKEWCDRKFFEKGNYGKYETTEEAGAVAFYPVPNTPLEGKVKFSFTETPPASGDKGPENPSTISGINSVALTQTGRNVFYIPYTNQIRSNVTLTKNNDGSYTLNGQSTLAHDGYAQFYQALPLAVSSQVLPQGTTFKMKLIYKSGAITKDPDSTRNYAVSLQSTTINTNGNYGYDSVTDVVVEGSRNYSGKRYISSTIIIAGTCIYNNYTFYPIFEFTNSENVSFEPAIFNNYTIQLGDTYYGGSIDLATGLMTVTHFLEQLSSSTNIVSTGFSEGQSAYRVGMYLSSSKERMSYPITSLEGYACNSFPVVGDPSANSAPCFGLAGGSILTYLCLTKAMLGVGDGATYDVVRAAVLSFLGSHQVKVAGKFATPYTVQLTPPQILALAQPDKYTPRFNTVYTDADSIQISYLKSPIRDEYEKTQAILSLGGNS